MPTRTVEEHEKESTTKFTQHLQDSSPASEKTEKSRVEDRASVASSSKMFSIDSILKKEKEPKDEKSSSDESDDVISDVKPDEPRLAPVAQPDILRAANLSVPQALLATSLPNPSAANPALSGFYPNPLLWESLAIRQRLLQTQLLHRNLLSSNMESVRLLNEVYSIQNGAATLQARPES